MKLIVDASVAVLWFVPQQHSASAALLLTRDHELRSPDVLSLEVNNALLRAVRRGLLQPDVAVEALKRLVRNVDLSESQSLLEDAFHLAHQQGGSAYDAIYLAAGRAIGAAVVTDDTRMLQTARAAQIPALHVSDPMLQR